MNFNRETYLAQIKPGAVFNDTGIVTVQPLFMGMPYEVALVHYLAPNENQGGQATYFDVLDANGRPLVKPTNLQVGWTWDGRHDDEPAPPAIFEKDSPEPGANITLFFGQHATVWLEKLDGGRRTVSNTASGFRTDLPGDGSGNRVGHNSFYVVFRPVAPTTSEPPTIPPTIPANVDLVQLRADVTELQKQVQNILSAIQVKALPDEAKG